MSAGERVGVLERDARTIYDVACIREGSPNATREDVDFKALALRHFNNIGAVAELVAAIQQYRNDFSTEECAFPDCGLCKRSKAAATRLDAAFEVKP